MSFTLPIVALSIRLLKPEPVSFPYRLGLLKVPVAMTLPEHNALTGVIGLGDDSLFLEVIHQLASVIISDAKHALDITG
jgi:hypothetical protein